MKNNKGMKNPNTLKYESKLDPEQLVSRFQSLKSNRYVWDNHWREIADTMVPRKNDILRETVSGTRKGIDIYDNTAMHSGELLAGALHGLLTNPATYFFGLSSGIPDIDNDDEVAAWCQDTVHRMHNALNESNFQTEVHELYLDQVYFGTSPLSIEEDKDYIFKFKAWHIKNVYIDEDPDGKVNTLYRWFQWDANKMLKFFGYDNLSRVVKRAIDTGDNNTKFAVIHAIYPSNPEEKNAHSFISQWVEEDSKKELKVGGYNEFPYVVPRWVKIAEELYGRSSGMTALPEAKTLNEQVRQSLIASQKIIDPPLQLPDDGFVLPIKTRPGGLNYFRAGMAPQDKIQPLFQQQIRLDLSESECNARRGRIKEAFYVDQLSLGQNNPQMTATEVNARQEQAMTMLGPMLGRQQAEFLQPLIGRLFGIMNRKKLLKPLPPKLKAHGKIIAKYTSLVAIAQRQVEARSTSKWLDAITPLVNADPSVKDNIDGDAGCRRLHALYGAPQEMLRKIKDRDQMRKEQAAAQQKAIQQQEESHQADVASKVLPAQAQAQVAQKQTMGGMGGNGQG
jgi:hypothetical protein